MNVIAYFQTSSNAHVMSVQELEGCPFTYILQPLKVGDAPVEILLWNYCGQILLSSEEKKESLSTCFLAYRVEGTIFVLDEAVWTGVSNLEIVQSFTEGSQMPHQVQLVEITKEYHTRLQHWGMLRYKPSSTVPYHKSLDKLVASGHFRAFLVVFDEGYQQLVRVDQHVLGHHRFNACLAAMPEFGPDPATDPAIDLERGMLSTPPLLTAQPREFSLGMDGEYAQAQVMTPQPAPPAAKPKVRKQCAVCQRTKMDNGWRLLHCSSCPDVPYCSKACQRLHWPQHKQVCKSL